jgi:hypothetical protein
VPEVAKADLAVSMGNGNLDESIGNGTPRRILRERLKLKDAAISDMTKEFKDIEEFVSLEAEVRSL